MAYKANTNPQNNGSTKDTGFDRIFNQPTPVSQDGSWDWGKPVSPLSAPTMYSNNTQGNMSLPTMFGGNTPTGLFNTQQQTSIPFAPQGGGGNAYGGVDLNSVLNPNNNTQQSPNQFTAFDPVQAYQATQQTQQLPQASSADIMQSLLNPAGQGQSAIALTPTQQSANLNKVLGRGQDLLHSGMGEGTTTLGDTTDYTTGIFGGMFNDDPNKGWWDEASGKDKYNMGMGALGAGMSLYNMFDTQKNRRGMLDVARGNLDISRDKLAIQQGEYDLTNKRRGIT